MTTNNFGFRFITRCLSTAGLLLGLLATSSTAAAGVKEQILYSFCSNGSMCLDGENPQSPVILDSAGNLYGTVYGGGDYGRGAVFELKRVANGKWTETI